MGSNMGDVAFDSAVDVLVCAENVGAEELALEVNESTPGNMIKIHDAAEFLKELYNQAIFHKKNIKK